MIVNGLNFSIFLHKLIFVDTLYQILLDGQQILLTFNASYLVAILSMGSGSLFLGLLAFFITVESGCFTWLLSNRHVSLDRVLIFFRA